MSEKKFSLNDLRKKEKTRRAEAKSIEEAQFPIDQKEIVQETEEASLTVCTITKEDGAHYRVVQIAEMMGMELKKVNTDGDHAYSYGPYVLFINKDKKTFNFNEVLDTGASFSMHVHEVDFDNMDRIKKDLSHALFLKGDDMLKKQMIKSKTAWESLYKKELGSWDSYVPKSV
tara:strand:- start:49 stop:567 length:519 start_codon:yes stop_codon:yes gene_type:complete